MKNKITAILLISVLTFSCLSGCKGRANTAKVPKTGNEEIKPQLASAERDGGRHPAFRQLAQSRLLFVGENNAVQSVHRTVSFPSRLSIRFALSVRPASTCASGPTTVMPHSSGGAASGDAPTRAFSPTRTFSPRMA